jgi:hypothetical protein
MLVFETFIYLLLFPQTNIKMNTLLSAYWEDVLLRRTYGTQRSSVKAPQSYGNN